MKKRLLIVVISIIILLAAFGVRTFSKSKLEKMDIEDVLKTEAYSYLNGAAKEYVKQYYEETGEILLTEKNKEENMPYLNPNFVDYLGLSDESRETIDVVPEEMIVDFSYSADDKTDYSSELPSKYDLRAVDKNGDGVADRNYISPLKNQGDLGICWAYATVEAAESYLMVSSDKSYKEGETVLFSPRQLDYGTSKSIKEFNNRYGSRELASGKHFDADLLRVGLSLFGTNWKYNSSTSLDKLELYEVLNYNESLYDVTSTINIPTLNIANLDLTDEANVAKKDAYLNSIKQAIINYGGPYVSSYAPGYPCATANSLDSNNTSIIRVDAACKRDGAHAMQIIGWDDDYQYKYCTGERHTKYSSSCSAANTVTGKGAWILRNSWGSTSSNAYIYLAYDSLYTTINFITGMTNQKNWDYVYDYYNKNMTISTSNKEYEVVLNSKFAGNAQLSLVKLESSSQNTSLELYVSSTGNKDDYVLVDTSLIEMPGVSTFDVLSKNISLNKKSKIKIKVNDGSITSSDIVVFTKASTNDTFINTDRIFYEKDSSNIVNNHYKVRVYSDTYNIKSGEKIDYKLFDDKGNDITDQMTVSQNIVAYNNVNTLIYVPIMDNDYFTLKTIYNDEVKSTSKLVPVSLHPALGSGTSQDPYVITTPLELYSINNDMTASYVLGADIDLTYDTQDANGIFYNDGLGWNPIGFDESKNFGGNLNGYYDGHYHKIIGLYSAGVDNKHVGGLFYGISNSNVTGDVSIQNIIFQDSIIKDSNILTKNISSYSTSVLSIQNVAFINTKASGSFSPIAYRIDAGGTINITNIFTSNSIEASSSEISSLIYQVYAAYASSLVNIKNIEILDVLNANDDSNNLYVIANKIAGNVNVANVIYPNSYKNIGTSQNFFDKVSAAVTGTAGSTTNLTGNIDNIYYSGNVKTNNSKFSENNVTSKTLTQFKDVNEYSTWDNFSNNWKIESINEISRMPILKFVPFEYTSVKNITLKLGEVVNIYDYIYPKIDVAKNVKITIPNNKIIALHDDTMIMGLKSGTVTIHIESLYDGYEGDITVSVLSSSYSISELNEKMYVTGLKNNTTVNNVITDFDLGNNFTIKLFDEKGKQLNNSNLIFTGSMTKIYLDDKLYGDFRNVVSGDVTGSGVVDKESADVIVKHIIEKETLKNEYLLAADINQDGKVKMDDVMKIIKSINN